MNKDKAKGHGKELLGSAKAKVGDLAGNKELQAKGEMQKAEGKSDRLKGEVKEKAHAAKETVKDKADELRGRTR